MSDESIVHRAFTIGVFALAAVFGGTVFGGLPVTQATPPVSTVATVLSDEQRSQAAAPAMATYVAKEIPAGPVPMVHYDVRIGGADFSHLVAVPVPVHFANAVYPDQTSPSADTAEPQITIRYQATKDAPHFFMTAGVSEMQAKIGGWINQPLDLAATGVTHIEITPTVVNVPVVNVPVVKPPAPAPAPEQKGHESHGDALRIGEELLAALAPALEIAVLLAKQMKERRSSRQHEDPSPASGQYRLEGNSVVLRTEGGITQTVITKEDIANSDDDGKRLISAWTESIWNLYHRWTDTYPKHLMSVDPLVNKQVDAQLDLLQNSFCTDLRKLKRFVGRTGKPLSGFEPIEAVCQG